MIEAEVMAPSEWRPWIRAHLARARSNLLWRLVGMDEATLNLTGGGDEDEHLPLDILQSCAHDGWWMAGVIERMSAPELPDDAAHTAGDPYAWIYEEGSWEELFGALMADRKRMLDALAGLPDERLDLLIPGTRFGQTVRLLVEYDVDADEFSCRQLEPWVEAAPAFGPTIILLAALRAARKSLLTAVALIPSDKRRSFPVGKSSLLLELRALAEREERSLERLGEQSASRADNGSWDSVWSGLHRVHEQVLRAVVAKSQEEMAELVGDETIYALVARIAERDREVDERVRSAIPILEILPASF
jgi:DinB superfamily